VFCIMGWPFVEQQRIQNYGAMHQCGELKHITRSGLSGG
jgi:hypothetical protein